MKYLTKALWTGAQQPAASGADENHAVWQKALREYRAELETIKHRLAQDALKFFTDANLHDGELLEFQVLDGSRPAPPGQPSQRILRFSATMTAASGIGDTTNCLMLVMDSCAMKSCSVAAPTYFLSSAIAQ
jgi:hypothetical protein